MRPKRAQLDVSSALLGAPRRAVLLGASAPGAALLAIAWLVAGSSPRTGAWLLFAGSLLLALGVLRVGAGLVPAALAASFAILGGLSAVAALAPSSYAAPSTAPPLGSLVDIGVLAGARWAARPLPVDAYQYAIGVTALGCVACVAGALLVGQLADRARRLAPRDEPPLRWDRMGQALVALGAVGMALALVRWGLADHPEGDLLASLKSFWTGGSYLLLVASFAVPGFGLWLAALLVAPQRRALLLWVACAAVFVLATVPTGQRGFALQLTIVAVAVVAWRGLLRVRGLVAVAVVAVVVLVVTQAVRNVVSTGGPVTASAVTARLTPAGAVSTFSDQLASIEWTADVAAYRDSLGIPNTFVALVGKPVPRGLYPQKVQGYGEEFTARLFPDAHVQGVNFATPLVAESDDAFGPVGVALVLALLGAVAAWLAGWVVRRPAAVRPVAGAAILWCSFALLRGDLANATLVVAVWAVPVLAVLLAARRAPTALRASGPPLVVSGSAPAGKQGAS